MIRRATRVAAGVVLAGAVLVAPAAANDKDKKSEEVETPAVTPLLEQAASPYVSLRADIAAIEENGTASAKAVRDAHHMLASHDSERMTKAFIAYAALVAADHPEFAEAIEEKTKRKRNREAFLKELRDNPAMVRELAGANAAISEIMALSARDAMRINKLGQAFIEDAYAMQQKAWARKKLSSNGMSRVNGAESWAEGRSWPTYVARPAIRSKAGNIRPNLVADGVWTTSWSAETAMAKPDQKSGAMMTRALVLAARYATDDLNEGQLDAFAISKPTNRCFKTAKLNLDQCMAATRNAYEETFCIGTHGLNDISRCVGWPASAGAPQRVIGKK